MENCGNWNYIHMHNQKYELYVYIYMADMGRNRLNEVPIYNVRYFNKYYSLLEGYNIKKFKGWVNGI